MKPINVMVAMGTRPEVIKLAPVVRELYSHPQAIRPIVVLTAQHREMADQALEIFGLTPDYDLYLMTEGHSLAELAARGISGMQEILEREAVDFLLVQGDTTTTLAAALAGFYNRIPVGHVEAGLRTHDKWSPFPEEVNRMAVTAFSSVHFAPTEQAKNNLLREGVPGESVIVTGNTVVDALRWIGGDAAVTPPAVTGKRSRVLVTLHRRENFGAPLERICDAVRIIASRYQDLEMIFPVHPNPKVRRTVMECLGSQERIRISKPMDYREFVNCLSRSQLIISDSGGVQEEAAALGIPVLVARECTERMEGVEAGISCLVGTDPAKIVYEADKLLRGHGHESKTKNRNPYGDGRAAQRIVRHILGRRQKSPWDSREKCEKVC